VAAVECLVRGVPVHYAARGEGAPVLALHGAGVDHHEVLACLEPVFEAAPGYRRIYPDLPGTGRTPAPETITSGDDVLEVLLAFVDAVVGDEPLLVVGHSAGGYYAQAIAARRRDQVAGLALVCPLLAGLRDVPEHVVVRGAGDIGSEEFRRYFTVHTPRTLSRYARYVAPAARMTDEAALARIGESWELTPLPGDEVPDRRPTLLVTGRQDSVVGYAAAWDLLERYPRATYAVLDSSGHALPHEQPEVLHALVTEWLARVRESPRRRP
jgi:pimeloyl-ACP methyl ester carboxylesterase